MSKKKFNYLFYHKQYILLNINNYYKLIIIKINFINRKNNNNSILLI